MAATKYVFVQKNEQGVHTNELTLVIDQDRLIIGREVTLRDGVPCHEYQDTAFRTKREFTNAYRSLYWRVRSEGFDEIKRDREIRPSAAWQYDADINIMVAAQNGTTPAK